MSSLHPPEHAQILVIGGGPSGSYAASALAREGVDVVLLEASLFPRYHIGESLIPSVRHQLRFIDAEEKVAAHGFARKPGAAMKFNQFKKEGYTDFVALGHDNNAWNVVRSEFDALLLDHASVCGAKVFHPYKATSIAFSPTSSASSPLGRPTSVTWLHTSCTSTNQCTGTTSFDYLIDASGRAGIMSTKYLKNRRFNANLKNIAMWGYWTGVGTYAQETAAEGAPWFEALTDESGWAWFIPLHDGTTSIGVVMDQKLFRKSSRPDALNSPSTAVLPLLPSLSSTPFKYTRLTMSPGTIRDRTDPSLPSSPYTNATPFSSPSPSSPTSSLSFSAGFFAPGSDNLVGRYLSSLELAPGVKTLIGGGTLLQGKKSMEIPGSMSGSARPSLSDTQRSVTFDSSFGRTPAPAQTVKAKEIQRPLSVGSRTSGEFYISSLDDLPSDGTIQTASDYSYSASSYAGEGWRIVGDAGAFIDPFFSSGVHLAMTSGLAAAASIAASIRGDCNEREAADWHSQRVTVSYTRFLVVVLSAYKQMRSQSTDVLSDVGEDNFDKAFSFLRPVIQGNADMGPRLSESEVQRALDFCTNLFNPTTPNQHEAVRRRIESLDMATSKLSNLAPGRAKVQPTAESPLRRDLGVTIDEIEDEEAGGTRRRQELKTKEVQVTGADLVNVAVHDENIHSGKHGGLRRPRSGTIDAVWNWLGKVGGARGPGDAETRSEQEGRRSEVSPSSHSPHGSVRRGTAHLIPTDEERNDRSAQQALLDVTAPIVAPSALDEIAERMHHLASPTLTQETTSLMHIASAGSPTGLLPALEIPVVGNPRSVLEAPFMFGADDAEVETKRVLAKINARRVIHQDHSGLHSLEEEALGDGGWTVRLERGKLGLVKAPTASDVHSQEHNVGVVNSNSLPSFPETSWSTP